MLEPSKNLIENDYQYAVSRFDYNKATAKLVNTELVFKTSDLDEARKAFDFEVQRIRDLEKEMKATQTTLDETSQVCLSFIDDNEAIFNFLEIINIE